MLSTEVAVLPFPERLVRRVVIVLVIAAALAAACADQPRIWFENQRDELVTIAIDGDRLIILWPRTGQFLPYSTAAWAWPRRIDASIKDGPLLWSAHLDAEDLANLRWRIYIRRE